MRKKLAHEDVENEMPADTTLGALLTPDGQLAGLLFVLSARELDALQAGAVVHHVVPGAAPIPIAICTRATIGDGQRTLEGVCSLIEWSETRRATKH